MYKTLFWPRNRRVFESSRFQIFVISRFQVFVISSFRNFELSSFRNFKVSSFRNFEVLSFRNFEVSSFRNFKLSSFHTIEPPGRFEASNFRVLEISIISKFPKRANSQLNQFEVFRIPFENEGSRLNELSFHVPSPRLGPKFTCLMNVRPSTCSKTRQLLFHLFFFLFTRVSGRTLFSPCISR